MLAARSDNFSADAPGSMPSARQAVSAVATALGTGPRGGRGHPSRRRHEHGGRHPARVRLRRRSSTLHALSFGGAAGLHITEVARMSRSRASWCRAPRPCSPRGDATDLRYELVRTHVGEVGRIADAVRRLSRRWRPKGGHASAVFRPITVRRSVEMRYGEQIFEIRYRFDGVDLGATTSWARTPALPPASRGAAPTARRIRTSCQRPSP